MTRESRRIEQALARIDAVNAEDPRTESTAAGDRPRELVYSERMSAWLQRLRPDAKEPLALAARAQHIRRWAIPRSDYPMDRPGYKQWRLALARYHAELTGELLREVGYDEETIERVGALLRKEKLKRDPDAQTLEDVACLVFLQYYFPEFARQHEEDKIVDILRKTWRKMSPQGHAAALELELPPELDRLVEAALSA